MKTLSLLWAMTPEIIFAAVLLAVVRRYCTRWAYIICMTVLILSAFAAGWIAL